MNNSILAQNPQYDTRNVTKIHKASHSYGNSQAPGRLHNVMTNQSQSKVSSMNSSHHASSKNFHANKRATNSRRVLYHSSAPRTEVT